MMPRGIKRRSTSCLGTLTSCVDTGNPIMNSYVLQLQMVSFISLCNFILMSADCALLHGM